MQINIELHYFCETPSLSRGVFHVNARAFRDNPDLEAARVALDWFKKVRREYLSEVKLEKIIYNSKHDITDIVKQLEWGYLQRIEKESDDLPF